MTNSLREYPRGDGHADFGGIVRDVRRFNRQALLTHIASLAAGLDDEPGRVRPLTRYASVRGFRYPRHIVLSTHGLAALARVVLVHGNKWETKAPTDDDVILLENHISNLPSFFTTEPLGSVLPHQVLFQMAKQQFQFQVGADKVSLGRNIVLYERIPSILEAEGIPPAVDIDLAFREITGMSIRQFMWSGFLVWTASKLKGTPAISTANLSRLIVEIGKNWRGRQNDRPTLEALEHFLNYTSLDWQGFTKNIGDLTKQDERLISVDFQPLLQYPVVRTNADQYVVPIPKLLFDRFTTGLFHDLANGMSGPDRENPFRSHFGRLFERYVGLQLASVFDRSQLMPEQNYGNEGKSTPDWVVNDPDVPIAVECRSSTFRLETQKYADQRRITEDLVRIGVDTLTHFGPKLEAIQGGNTGLRLVSAVNPLPVICTFESLEPLGLFGALLDSEFQALGQQAIDFCLMPMSFLEEMCATLNREIFLGGLQALKVDNTWHDMTDEGPETRWRRRMPEPIPSNRILMDAAEAFFSDAVTRP